MLISSFLLGGTLRTAAQQGWRGQRCARCILCVGLRALRSPVTTTHALGLLLADDALDERGLAIEAHARDLSAGAQQDL